MKENDILQAQDVRFRYDTEQPNFAVDGVSMEVHRGEFVAVLGANGCGKSTLAKHFNAILLPESGTVLVEDMDTLRLCRDCADTILADDPNLDKPKNQPLLTETQDLFRRSTT